MNAAGPAAWVIGTYDTKADELDYIARLLRAAGLPVLTVDIGTGRVDDARASSADMAAAQVAAFHPQGAAAVFDSGDRGRSVIAMGEALCALVRQRLESGGILGMIGLGGSGGTSMIAPAMRLLPIGRPKLLVSTMASGNMAPFVDVVDMTTVYPVTDIAGLNRLSRTILANAAHAFAGMLLQPAAQDAEDDTPSIGLSMFGVTTPCVQALRERLRDRFDCQVFHANGAGGRTLEALAAAGMLRAIVDVTTTEVGQNLAGGVCDAGPGRLDAAAKHGLPWIGSVGALDMINWGARDTVPERHAKRLFHVHNANVTLMRSNAAELTAAGERMAAQLNRSAGEVRLFLPLGGLSMLDAPGQPFHDPEADAALFGTLEKHFVQTDRHRLIRLPLHINDERFADALARETLACVARPTQPG